MCMIVILMQTMRIYAANLRGGEQVNEDWSKQISEIRININKARINLNMIEAELNDIASGGLNCGNCEHYKETFMQGWCSYWHSNQTVISSKKFVCDKHKLKGGEQVNSTGYKPTTGGGGPNKDEMLTKKERIDALLSKLSTLERIMQHSCAPEMLAPQIDSTLREIDKELGI